MTVFETDDDRTYFVGRFPIHPKTPHLITKEEKAEPEKHGTKPRRQSQYQSDK